MNVASPDAVPMSLRLLPLLGVLAFLAVSLGVRSLLHRRRYGSSGIVVIGHRADRPALIERGAIALPILLLAESAAACTQAGHAALASLDVPRWRGPLAVLGILLMLGGTAAMFVAQLHMGASWRIGIDRSTRPGLVTGGLYRFSRNPIYTFMFVVLAGFVVLLPGWVTLATFVLTAVGFRIAVVEEEAHLTTLYGDAYRTYIRQVGRFLPRIVRRHATGATT